MVTAIHDVLFSMVSWFISGRTFVVVTKECDATCESGTAHVRLATVRNMEAISPG